VDANTVGLGLIGVAVGAFVVWAVTHKRPDLRLWSRLSVLVMVLLLIGVVALLGSSFLSGWYGDPD